jgi:hypothetical protein
MTYPEKMKSAQYKAVEVVDHKWPTEFGIVYFFIDEVNIFLKNLRGPSFFERSRREQFGPVWGRRAISSGD